LKGIVAEIKLLGCGDAKKKTSHQQRNAQHVAVQVGQGDEEELCTQLLFDMATALVFYNLDAKKGLDTYRHLASERDHVDSMVACGIVLTEGLGVDPNEKEGISWLQRAISKDDNPQALYELGTLYYTGLDGVLDEDPTRAFELFERAAAQNHTGAMYMVADCLVEGEGCTKSVARAVPLFYKAAERGHRYSRQRIRELLAKIDYPF
jgi:TPR repeat protein